MPGRQHSCLQGTDLDLLLSKWDPRACGPLPPATVGTQQTCHTAKGAAGVSHQRPVHGDGKGGGPGSIHLFPSDTPVAHRGPAVARKQKSATC